MTEPDWDTYLQQQLDERASTGQLRRLPPPLDGRPDFCSNDYLGLARLAQLRLQVAHLAQDAPTGSTGSRLLAGNSELAMQVEAQIAAYHGAEAGLLFASGYQANVGLFQALAGRGDTILYDEHIHASMRDGIRLSLAQAFRFRHNDLDDLQARLARVPQPGTGRVLIAVEALYSMEGDTAPLGALAQLCARTGARLVVDEAHSNGILGPQGRGLATHPAIAPWCLARVYTFGKALGSHGAIVLGSTTLRDYLVNFCRSFIYTTAPPAHTLYTLQAAYQLLPGLEAERQLLQVHTGRLRAALQASGRPFVGGDSPIFGVLAGGDMAQLLQALAPVQVLPVRSPTVARGQERVRICLHSFNTPDDVSLLIGCLS
ncbi:MAG: aminotransferase class I/II-fold pyridoxal phosphate-dependent enzyme [Sphingobacteriia bacterium]|jgi:8-amino-7-oxononanoate synthase